MSDGIDEQPEWYRQRLLCESEMHHYGQFVRTAIEKKSALTKSEKDQWVRVRDMYSPEVIKWWWWDHQGDFEAL